MTPDWRKDLEEALAVTNRIQNKHALMIEDHQKWLEAMQERELHICILLDRITAVQLANAEGLRELKASLQNLKASVRRSSIRCAAAATGRANNQGLRP
jgi:hypothetical protein